MSYLTLHLFTLAVTALAILYADHQGFLYFRGRKHTLSREFVVWSHRLVWVGLLLMIFSGGMMAYPAWEYYVTEPAFLVKMFFVVTLVINAFAIGKLSHVAVRSPFAELSKREKTQLLLSGALSGICWLGAAILGYFFL